MKILVLSYNDINKDGRLNEINRVMQKLGEVYIINVSSSKRFIPHPNIYTFKNKGILSYFLFVLYCVRQAQKLGPFDMVVADNRKGIIPAFLSKILSHIKYSLYDAREFYIYKEMGTFSSKLGCLIEKLFVPRFQIITCANKYRSEGMQELYGLKYTPIVFENIRKLEYSDNSEKECADKFSYLFHDKNFINIVTTSGEALIRRADVLVEALAKLGHKYRLFLIGYEDEEGHKKIEDICQKNNWHNIVRYKWLSKSQLKYILSHCDIGIVNYSFQNTNNKYCASGKLYEFIFENLPVVTTSNPPLRLCEEKQIGVVDDNFYEGIMKVSKNYLFYKTNVAKLCRHIDIESNTNNVAKDIANYIKIMEKK